MKKLIMILSLVAVLTTTVSCTTDNVSEIKTNAADVAPIGPGDSGTGIRH